MHIRFCVGEDVSVHVCVSVFVCVHVSLMTQEIQNEAEASE